ncbi:hypothetical protein ACIQTN_29840 [Streptomyces werraensis]|uniref:hypothetical protein n=1 Tax=Streptomyces werraensis TaxID=68284 RepID=UPI00380CCBA0
MPNPLPRQVLVAVGLCALLVLLFSCAAAVHDDGDAGDCQELGLAAAAKPAPPGPAPARPVAPPAPLHKDPAPAHSAHPAPTARHVTKAPHAAPSLGRGHGHGGVDVDLHVCP